MRFVFQFKLRVFRFLRERNINFLLRSLVRPVAPLVPERILRKLPVVGDIRVPLPNGRTLLLASDGRDWIASRIYWKGLQWYEPETLAVYLELLKYSKVVFDVGANTGLFALLAALDDDTRQVHAFEPVPEIFEGLVTNTRINGRGNLRPVRAAATDFDGRLDLYVPRMVTLPLSSSSRADLRNDTEKVAAPALRLDTYAAANQVLQVDLIKVDTEGTEDKVLEGARSILERDRPLIICEVLRGRTEKALQGIFADTDYRCYHISKTGLVPTDRIVADEAERERNYLFVAAEKISQMPCVRQSFQSR